VSGWSCLRGDFPAVDFLVVCFAWAISSFATASHFLRDVNSTKFKWRLNFFLECVPIIYQIFPLFFSFSRI
jgi:hypothetical protein